MAANLYIVRHGKIYTDEKIREEYLHLNDEGKAFAVYLNQHFKNIYFDHIFYQSTDIKTSDPYNRCRNTIHGMKGVKSEFDKTHFSKVLEELNDEGSGVQNVMICFRAEAFYLLSSIINPASEEEFSKDYNRIFQYQFAKNNYRFIGKFSANKVV